VSAAKAGQRHLHPDRGRLLQRRWQQGPRRHLLVRPRLGTGRVVEGHRRRNFSPIPEKVNGTYTPCRDVHPDPATGGSTDPTSTSSGTRRAPRPTPCGWARVTVTSGQGLPRQRPLPAVVGYFAATASRTSSGTTHRAGRRCWLADPDTHAFTQPPGLDRCGLFADRRALPAPRRADLVVSPPGPTTSGSPMAHRATGATRSCRTTRHGRGYVPVSATSTATATATCTGWAPAPSRTGLVGCRLTDRTRRATSCWRRRRRWACRRAPRRQPRTGGEPDDGCTRRPTSCGSRRSRGRTCGPVDRR